METFAIKCSNCTGVTEIEQSKKQGLCQHCGEILEVGDVALVSLNQNKTRMTEDEERLAALKEVDAHYLNQQITFDELLNIYEEAHKAGATDSGFWLARARIYAVGSIKEFEAGQLPNEAQNQIVTQYIQWIELAITTSTGNTTPLKMEKEKTIGDINNTFAGPQRREENEAWAKAFLEEERQVEMLEEAEAATEELEAAIHKNKKRHIIIIVGSVIVLLFLGFILLRACMPGEEEADVTYYEMFLESAYMLEFFDEVTTRDDILDLNLDFDLAQTAGQTIRISAPTAADLDRLTFHFDEDDYLSRIVVDNGTHFNGFLASEGLTLAIFDGIDVEEFDETDHAISATTETLHISIRLTPNEQFVIDMQQIDEGLTAEEQALWDLIEDRITEGYETWADLLEWAVNEDVLYVFLEDEQKPTTAIWALIEQYGLVGDYLFAEPGLIMLEEDDETPQVGLLLHFEDLSYNEMIAELKELNQHSNRELNSWLESGGKARLEAHFGDVEIVDLDEDGEILTEMPEVVEFVIWEIEFVDLFKPAGVGRIRIQRMFQVIEIEEEEEEEEEEDEEEEEEIDETPAPPTGRVTLSQGEWVVGVDVAQGRFVISGDSTGGLTIWRGEGLITNEVLGGGGFGVDTVNTYLLNGDRIVINDINNTIFNPVTSRTQSNVLTTGTWVVGVDIQAGTFNASVPTGFGNLIVFRGSDVLVNEALEDGSYGIGHEYVAVTLVAGDLVMITGVNRVNFE